MAGEDPSDPAGAEEPSAPVDALFDLVYAELRDLASRALRAQRTNHTLQPTALVHEVWLKLAKGLTARPDRAHLLAIAARAMRQVLADHARGHLADKRGQGAPAVQLDEHPDVFGGVEPGGVDLVSLDDALHRLAALNERHAWVAELRLLGGLTLPEVAREVDVSLRTAEGDWQMARAWLRAELE